MRRRWEVARENHGPIRESHRSLVDYVDVKDAIEMPGMRLALSAGVPGPWGEAAKSIFFVKRIEYTPVRQLGGGENDALQAWTGRDNAPIAVYENEPGRDGWAEILDLAERLEPTPRLIPADLEQRVEMFGLAREICGPDGFGWHRRTLLLAPLLSDAVPDAAKVMGRRLADKYGFSEEAVSTAGPRVIEVLQTLAKRLLAQREVGSRYFLGDSLTALDIYWACFAALLQPMPDEQCPMPAMLRAGYTVTDPETLAAADPILLEHRDFIYAEHLELPLQF
jgi:hypothetical protein